MKKIFLLTVFCFVTTYLTAQKSYSKEVEAQIKQVENNLAQRVILNGKAENLLERMAYHKVKGVSIAVIDDYKVVWAKGYGWADEAEKRPVTPQTLFSPGSISKSFNAMGILKLAQDKKLDLNTDINTYLSSWKFPYDSLSKGKKITLTHLLSHSAGLNFCGNNGYDRNAKIPTLLEILDGKFPASSPAVRSEFEPGLYHQYSNGGIAITQQIAIDLSKQPYDKFMYETVLKPLGMMQSSFTQPPPLNASKLIATGYNAKGISLPTKFNILPDQAAGGLWTTPSEVCKYVIEMQLAYKGKSAKILSPEMTKLALTPTVDEVCALGIFIDKRGDTKYFTHDARNYGYCGVYYGSMESGKGVVIFLNSDNVSLLPEIANSVATVYKWQDFYTPIYKNTISIADSTLQKYVGVYRTTQNKFTNILQKADGYYLIADGTYSKMYFTNETDFFNMEFSTEKHFMRDSLGKVIGYSRTLKGVEQPFLTKIVEVDTLTGEMDFFNTTGWYLLENKKCKEAEKYLKRGLDLYPTSSSIALNLAHTYLFGYKYEEALNMYKKHLLETSNEAELKNDFTFFKENDFDKELMKKIFTALKVEMPTDF